MPACITVGAMVTVRFSTERIQTVFITDTHNATPLRGVVAISPEAPLARALIGASPGDHVCYEVEGQRVEVAIIK